MGRISCGCFSALERENFTLRLYMGRYIFCVDVRDGKIIVCDTCASQCYALPVSMKDFLNECVADMDTDFLNAAEYRRWMAANGPLPYGCCAGWKIPLFLIGSDDMENRELTDMEVHWGVFGQIRQQVMGDDYGQNE